MAKRSKSRAPSAVVSAGAQELRLFSIPGIPEIRPGNNLVKCLTSAARRAAIHFAHGDILVVAQKIVSKAEGALIRLASVKTSPEARALAARLKKDPHAIEDAQRATRHLTR